MNQQQQFVINLKQDMGWHMHRLHFHEHIEIMLILSDGGRIFLDKDMYPLNRNTLIILKPNTLHRTTILDNDTMFQRYVFHIFPGMVEQLSTSHTNFLNIIMKESTPCIQLTDEQTAELARQFELLRIPSVVDSFGYDIKQSVILLNILLQVCSAVHHSTEDDIIAQEDTTSISSPDYDKIQPILEYIQAHYTEPITLDELAEHFHISKHYLCHSFKKGTGFSVMEYIIQARIIESQKLLRAGRSVQEACEGSGFRSYAHYIRTFSNTTGISPKQYAMQFEKGIILKEK